MTYQYRTHWGPEGCPSPPPRGYRTPPTIPTTGWAKDPLILVFDGQHSIYEGKQITLYLKISVQHKDYWAFMTLRYGLFCQNFLIVPPGSYTSMLLSEHLFFVNNFVMHCTVLLYKKMKSFSNGRNCKGRITLDLC